MSNCIRFQHPDVPFTPDEINIPLLKHMLEKATKESNPTAWWFLQKNTTFKPEGVVISFGHGRSEHTLRDFKQTLLLLQPLMLMDKIWRFRCFDESDGFAQAFIWAVNFKNPNPAAAPPAPEPSPGPTKPIKAGPLPIDAVDRSAGPSALEFLNRCDAIKDQPQLYSTYLVTEYNRVFGTYPAERSQNILLRSKIAYELSLRYLTALKIEPSPQFMQNYEAVVVRGEFDGCTSDVAHLTRLLASKEGVTSMAKVHKVKKIHPAPGPISKVSKVIRVVPKDVAPPAPKAPAKPLSPIARMVDEACGVGKPGRIPMKAAAPHKVSLGTNGRGRPKVLGHSVTVVARHLHTKDPLVTPEAVVWVCGKHGFEPTLVTVKDLMGYVRRGWYKNTLKITEEAASKLEATLAKAPAHTKALVSS